ncbi:MAG: TolC family protein [Nitrospirae bacterium]|nr:MAG: TolC family protein [Nitrospirota bacterium]
MKKVILKGLIVFLAVITWAPRACPLSISQGLKMLQRRALELRIAERTAEMASKDVEIANSYRLPQIELYANQTWLRYQPEAEFGLFGPVPVSEKDYLTYGFRINQLVYDFGRTGSMVGASKKILALQKKERERILNLLSRRFINAYLDLLETERLIDVSEKEVESLQSHKRDAEALFEAGVVVRNDLLQAEVMLSDARQRHIELENLRKIRQSTINRMLGEDLNREFRTEEPEVLAVKLPISLDEAWKEAVQNRIELKELDLRLSALEDKKRAIRAEFMPGVYLSGGYEYQENRYMVHEGNWMLAAGLKMELFSGGRTRAEMKKTEIEIEKLRTEKERLSQLIRLEVKGAWLELESAKKRVDVTKKAIEQAEENLRLQKLRYQEAVGTATEVTDAIALLAKAKTNYWRALYALKKAEAALLYAMGIRLADVYK